MRSGQYDVNVELSKAMSHLLRHGLNKSGIAFDAGGWVKIADMLALPRLRKFKASTDDVAAIVRNCRRSACWRFNSRHVEVCRLTAGTSRGSRRTCVSSRSISCCWWFLTPRLPGSQCPFRLCGPMSWLTCRDCPSSTSSGVARDRRQDDGSCCGMSPGRSSPAIG